MALSDDLRTRVVESVLSGGLSRNVAARHFKVSVASAVRWVKQFETTGEISPKACGGDRRSSRIEAHHTYLMGLIRRTPDITLLEIEERLIKNCGERFSSSVLWRKATLSLWTTCLPIKGRGSKNSSRPPTPNCAICRPTAPT